MVWDGGNFDSCREDLRDNLEDLQQMVTKVVEMNSEEAEGGSESPLHNEQEMSGPPLDEHDGALFPPLAEIRELKMVTCQDHGGGGGGEAEKDLEEEGTAFSDRIQNICDHLNNDVLKPLADGMQNILSKENEFRVQVERNFKTECADEKGEEKKLELRGRGEESGEEEEEEEEEEVLRRAKLLLKALAVHNTR
eukprot:757603-Hanusia_phi.AAC.1